MQHLGPKSLKIKMIETIFLMFIPLVFSQYQGSSDRIQNINKSSSHNINVSISTECKA